MTANANMAFRLLLLISLSMQYATSSLDLLVESNAGLIQGLRGLDGNYSMFLGIPYGVVNPDNPFGLAETPARFETPFEAYNEPTICPQVEEFNFTIVGDIDCLHLNIYVPDTASSTNPLPVLVWIYGGGFSIGFSGGFLYGPNFLIRHDIILVTLNYRLGPYGFMCLHTPEIPGNQGLKDQVMALRWIQNNIASFGGDPNKVTIAGNSAGSMSADYHLRSPQEKLFNSVIMQSGNVIDMTAPQGPDFTYPINLAARIGLTTADYREALTYLTTKHPHAVIEAASRFNTKMPCIENEEVSESVVTVQSSDEIPKVTDMPVLLGVNEYEMILNYLMVPEDYLNNADIITKELESQFKFPDDTDYLEKMERIVRHFYIGDNDFIDTIPELGNLASDISFNYAAIRSARKYIDNKAGNTFFYVFAYVGNRNFVRFKNNVTFRGAVHADEIGYLFDGDYLGRDVTPEDQVVIDHMTAMWANFVKYGNPTPQSSDLPVTWEPITASRFPHIRIDNELSSEGRPFQTRIAFWDLFHKAVEKWETDNDGNGANNLINPYLFVVICQAIYFVGHWAK